MRSYLLGGTSFPGNTAVLVIVCSDNAEATMTVSDLVTKIPGLRAIDGGRLENARIVEQITALLIGLNIRHQGHGGIRVTGLPPLAYKSS